VEARKMMTDVSRFVDSVLSKDFIFSVKNQIVVSWVRWHTPIVSALRRRISYSRSLGYIVN
jgi:hypothetical protein